MSDGCLRIRNWRKFQHYTDRRPPWIKLHESLLENTAFYDLADYLKVQLMSLWLVASKYDNEIPARPEWLERFNLSHKELDLAALIETGFVEIEGEEIPAIAEEQGASKALAQRKQAASASVSVSNSVSKELQEVYDYWRERLGKTDARYAKRIAPNRKNKIAARLREFSVDELKRAIDGVALDPWEDRPRHNDLTVVFRSQEQVEKFLAIAENPTPRSGGLSVADILKPGEEAA